MLVVVVVLFSWLRLLHGYAAASESGGLGVGGLGLEGAGAEKGGGAHALEGGLVAVLRIGLCVQGNVHG